MKTKLKLPKMSAALLDFIKDEQGVFTFKELIIRFKEEKGLNITHNAMSVLIELGKVERVSVGFYQLKKVS